MDLGLAGGVVVVTGGASGIGAAVTLALLREGAYVVALSRRSAGVQEFAEARAAEHAAFELIELELAEVAACRQAMQRVAEVVATRGGRFNGLVNNAGVNDGVGLAEGSPERFVASLHTNLLPAYVLAQLALPLLTAPRGAIVNVASKVALTGQGGTSGYAAAKGALLALTREWAVELAARGIRVNAVVPAEVQTPAYDAWLANAPDPAARLARIERQIPLGTRRTAPEEIASAVLFLLSPVHSAHTTGQHLVVDGGYVHLDRMLTA